MNQTIKCHRKYKKYKKNWQLKKMIELIKSYSNFNMKRYILKYHGQIAYYVN